MILLSLEDPKDIAVCGGGEWGRDLTHPKERLQIGLTRASNSTECEERTASMLEFEGICMGIAGGVGVGEKRNGGEIDPNKPIGRNHPMNIWIRFPGAWHNRVKQRG